MSANLFNFSRVSPRDEQAYASGRPGFPNKEVNPEDVPFWVEFMKAQGIKRVLSLLGDDEVREFFPWQNIDTDMENAFGKGNYHRTSLYAPNARSVIFDAFSGAKESGDTIVMHCSGGEGRAALAMGLWLIQNYGISPSDAVREIDEETSRNDGVSRRTNASKLEYLLSNGSLIGYK